MMRRFLAIIALFFLLSPVVAEDGFFSGGPLTPSSSWFDSAYCNTVGYVIVRTTGAWKCSNSIPADPKWWGAAGDNSTDDTNAINAALSSGAQRFHFSTGKYKISSLISITTPLYIEGDGRTTTVIRQSGGALGGIAFAYASETYGGGISNLSIEGGTGFVAGGSTAQGSTGVGLLIQNCNRGFTARNFGVHNFDFPIVIQGTVGSGGCFGALVEDFDLSYFSGTGIQIDPSGDPGGDRAILNGIISNTGYSGTNTSTIGIKVFQSGGDFFDTIDITSANNGVVVQPATSKLAAYLFFNKVLADTSTSDNWTFNGSAGTITSAYLLNCWGAFSTNGSGLVTFGPNLQDLNWVGGRLRENGQYGWHHSGGTYVYVRDASIAQNSKSSNNAFDGVLIDAALTYWGVQNSTIGNFASGLGTTQANGINITSSSSTTNFQVTGNNFPSPGSGKTGISFSTLGTSYDMSGNLPAATGYNPSSAQVLSISTGNNSIGSGATDYLGPQAPTTNNGVNEFVVDRAGLVSSLQMQSASAPSAGQTYVYTVMKNASATSMTCTTSGAASFSCSTTSNPVTVAAGDRLSVQLVTSASAISSVHRGSLSVQP